MLGSVDQPANAVSVAGCLGYDVLVSRKYGASHDFDSFSCWLFRL